MQQVTSAAFRQLLATWRALPVPERVSDWPADHFAALQAAGGWTWNLPRDCGGQELAAGEILEIYRRLASASLVTTFILTQRNAACQRIACSDNAALRARCLAELCSGRTFATVGISHLTTSRQFLQTPIVTACRTPQDDGYLLQGRVPWATGATRAQLLVTGGTLADGRQILAAVPTDRSGVDVQPPVELLGLNASQTGAVDLHQVFVSDGEVLHGPAERVMSQRSGGEAGSLGTSALAIGATEGMLAALAAEAQQRAELMEFLQPLQQAATVLGEQLLSAAAPAGSSPAATAGSVSVTPESLRERANLLVLRTAQVWLAATKGAGYVASHPAARAVRESMFFLVWSCPQPVLQANLQELSCVYSSDSGGPALN